MQCSQLTRHSHHTIGAIMTPPPVNPNLNCLLSSTLSCSSGLYRETHKKVKVQQYALHCIKLSTQQMEKRKRFRKGEQMVSRMLG